MDKLCLHFPAFFFEMLTEIEGDPFELYPFQLEYINDPKSFKIMNKTRQAGGSLIVSAAKFFKAYRNEYYRCDIVSFNLKEAKGKIRYIRDLWETLPMRWRHPLSIDNAFSIGFHEGRSKSEINSLAASAGIRGGKKDIFFDEASSIEKFEELYVAALPATIRGKGQFDVVSTPLGQQGKFWEIFTNVGEKYPTWSRHQFYWFDVPEFCKDMEGASARWQEYEQNYSMMPDLFDEFANDRMREIASELTQEEFNQEFACQFVDESASFFPWELLLRCAKNDEPQFDGDDDYFEMWHVRPENNDNEVFIGIDFAEGRKGGDETSIQVIEKLPDGDVRLRASFDLSYEKGYSGFTDQMRFITEVIEKFAPTRVRVDKTGLGLKIHEDLQNKHGHLIEGVPFSQQSKEEMAMNLKGLIERERIWVSNENKKLLGQIHGIQRVITTSGNNRFFGEPHDDMFWALALACRGLGRKPFRVITI